MKKMKKILSIVYFTLTWFVCVAQTSQIVSYSNTDEPFLFLDNQGYFEYVTPDNKTFRLEFKPEEVKRFEDYVLITKGEYNLALVSENGWITQYVLYRYGVVIDMFDFKLPETR